MNSSVASERFPDDALRSPTDSLRPFSSETRFLTFAIVAALVPLLGSCSSGRAALQIGQVHVDRIVGDALLENDFGRNEHDTERQVGNDHAAQPDPVLVSP